MRLAYVTTYDAADVNEWSGLGHYIAQSLDRPRVHLDYVGPLEIANDWIHMGWKASLYPFRKRHLTERQPDVARFYARQVAARLPALRPDIVFSPGSVPVSKLECDAPIVFWTDACFAALRSTYPEFQNVARESIAKGEALEQEALSRCRLAIYSSDWAAQSAIDHYDVDPAKVKVVPFGANIDSNKNPIEIDQLIESRPSNECRLLFLGREWHRKGGDIAVEIARNLNEAGLPTELDVVGCVPEEPLPRFVKVHGLISKSTPEGKAAIDDLLANAHFLVQPSRAECYGLAFAEASANAVPSVASKVGGIPTVVRDGANGRTFDPGASPADYAAYIAGIVTDHAAYRTLALSSYREYRDRLNWNVAGRAVLDLLDEISVEADPFTLAASA